MDKNIANWDFGASAIPDNADEWSEWLRWDPTQDAVSPNSSTKTSNNSPIQDVNYNADQFPPLGADDTLAPPLIVGDDANFADFSMDDASFDFGQTDGKTDDLPFLFGTDSNSLQPIVDHLRTDPKDSSTSLWPSFDPTQTTQLQQLSDSVLRAHPPTDRSKARVE